MKSLLRPACEPEEAVGAGTPAERQCAAYCCTGKSLADLVRPRMSMPMTSVDDAFMVTVAFGAMVKMPAKMRAAKARSPMMLRILKSPVLPPDKG